MKNHDKYKDEHLKLVSNILECKEFNKLIYYKQHGNTNRLEHSLNVSYYMYVWCKIFKLDADSAARAGLLHDFCFGKLHAIEHPKIALKNSEYYFRLNEKEKDIILKHMWPICLGFPKYYETFLITIIDKACAINEYGLAFHGTAKNKLKKVVRSNTY